MEDVSSPGIEADLERLESSLRQLKVQYDMFFAGALSREPYELRAKFDQLIKRYTNAPIRKYAHRFQFNAVVSRYNSLSEFWSKTLRSIEEGDRPTPALMDRGTAERVLTTCRVHDPLQEQEPLRILHERFLDARRRIDGQGGGLSFDSFLQGVVAQASRLQKKSGCDEVELRVVVENRKVHLKARPGR